MFNLNYLKSRYGDDWYTVYFHNYGNSTDFWDGDYLINDVWVWDELNTKEELGGSLILDYSLPGGKIIYSGILTDSRVDKITYAETYLDHSNYKRLILNNALRYEQQIGRMSLDAGVSNVSLDHSDAFRYSIGFGSTEPYFIPDSFTIQNLIRVGPWDLYNWFNPDSRNTYYVVKGTYTPRTYDENQWLAEMNVKIPLKITEKINIDLKAGGRYKRIDRSYDEIALLYHQGNFAR